MGLPEQVRKAKEKSDQLLKENYGLEPGQTPPPAETTPNEQPTTVTPTETPPAQTEGQPPVTPVPPATETNWEKVATEAQQKLKELEQKHATLDGKYRNETTELTNRLAEAMQQIAEIKISLANQNKPATDQTPATTTPATSPEDDRLLDAAKREFPDVYPWVVVLVNKTIGEQVEKVVSKYTGDLKALAPKVESIEKRVVKTDEDSFYARMDQLVSDWRTIVQDSAFAEFLKTPDRFSGRPLYELLALAVQSLDATRTAELYKAFKEHKTKGGNGGAGPSTPAATVTETTPSAPATTPAAPRVEEDVAPPRGTPGGLPRVEAHVDPNASTEVITRDYIRSFYKDCALQKYRGRDDERRKIEATINKAVQEGRVE